MIHAEHFSKDVVEAVVKVMVEECFFQMQEEREHLKEIHDFNRNKYFERYSTTENAIVPPDPKEKIKWLYVVLGVGANGYVLT